MTTTVPTMSAWLDAVDHAIALRIGFPVTHDELPDLDWYSLYDGYRHDPIAAVDDAIAQWHSMGDL